MIISGCSITPVDTGRKLNVHKTFRRRPGRLLNVLCTFNLRHVSTGTDLTILSQRLTKYRDKDSSNTLCTFVKNFGRITLDFIPTANNENICTTFKCFKISATCLKVSHGTLKNVKTAF